MKRGDGRAALLIALSLVPIAVATMGPLGTLSPRTAVSGAEFWCVACGGRGTADFILNVFLFLPLGAALRSAGVRSVSVALMGLALSGAVEAAQFWIPGRHSALGDLLANGVGAGLGALWASVGIPRLRRSGTPVRAAAAGALGLVAVGGMLAFTAWAFRPSLQEQVYYGQWTAVLGHYAPYQGEVISARIGDQAAPSRRLKNSEAAREALRSGDTLHVTFTVGPEPSGIAPIFSIYDDLRHEVLVIGADEDDLVLRIRRRAADLRLESPDVRWPDAMAGVDPGDIVHVKAWRDGWAGHCLLLARKGRRVEDESEGGPGSAEIECRAPGLQRGWMLFTGPDLVPVRVRWVADLLWVGVGVTAGAWLVLLVL